MFFSLGWHPFRKSEKTDGIRGNLCKIRDCSPYRMSYEGFVYNLFSTRKLEWDVCGGLSVENKLV